MSLRLRRMDSRIRTLGDLQMQESDLKQMRRLISRPGRHVPFHRPHLPRQVDHDLRRPERAQPARDQDHDRRGSDRAADRGRPPGPGGHRQGADFRRAAAFVPALGPQHHPGRRDPRSGNGRNGGRRRPHRPLGLQHAPRAQRRGRADPAGGPEDPAGHGGRHHDRRPVAAADPRLCPICKVAVRASSCRRRQLFVEAGLEPPEHDLRARAATLAARAARAAATAGSPR